MSIGTVRLTPAAANPRRDLARKFAQLMPKSWDGAAEFVEQVEDTISLFDGVLTRLQVAEARGELTPRQAASYRQRLLGPIDELGRVLQLQAKPPTQLDRKTLLERMEQRRKALGSLGVECEPSTAYHEAGHALLGVLLGFTPLSVDCFRQEPCWLGTTIFPEAALHSACWPLLLGAGAAAEDIAARHYGTHDGPGREHLLRGTYSENTDGHKLAAIYPHVFTHARCMEDYLRLCVEEAKAYLYPASEALEALATALQERGSLTGAEVAQIVAENR